jgi:hypothetical protein
MNKLVKRYNKALENYAETISAIEFLPPRGDGAKDEVKKELKQAYTEVTKSAKALQEYIEVKYL